MGIETISQSGCSFCLSEVLVESSLEMSGSEYVFYDCPQAREAQLSGVVVRSEAEMRPALEVVGEMFASLGSFDDSMAVHQWKQ